MVGAIAAALAAACAAAADAEVRIKGDRAKAMTVLRLIRAAEAGDERQFQRLTGRSALNDDGGPPLAPPRLEDVDRTDESCALRSLDASISTMVEAIWDCPENSKPVVERMFIVEGRRVTHMWNDWVSPGVE